MSMRDGLGDWRNAVLGGQVNPGWEPLVDTLYARITEVAPEIVVDQVKEKFGGLRFYYDLPQEAAERTQDSFPITFGARTVGEQVERLVSAAETASHWICEVCGKGGARTDTFGSGWLNTLCDEHGTVRREQNIPAWQQAEALKS